MWNRPELRIPVPGLRQVNVKVVFNDIYLNAALSKPEMGAWCADCPASLLCLTEPEVFTGTCEVCRCQFVLVTTSKTEDRPPYGTHLYNPREDAVVGLASQGCSHLNTAVMARDAGKNRVCPLCIKHVWTDIDKFIAEKTPHFDQLKLADLVCQCVLLRLGHQVDTSAIVEIK